MMRDVVEPVSGFSPCGERFSAVYGLRRDPVSGEEFVEVIDEVDNEEEILSGDSGSLANMLARFLGSGGTAEDIDKHTEAAECFFSAGVKPGVFADLTQFEDITLDEIKRVTDSTLEFYEALPDNVKALYNGYADFMERVSSSGVVEAPVPEKKHDKEVSNNEE